MSGRPHIKWTAWKGNDLLYYAILLKVDYMQSFFKKIPFEMVIGQQMKEEGYDQNY